MVDLANVMIRTDIVRKNFYYLDDSFYRKLNITRDFYEKYLGRYNYLIEFKDGYYYTKSIIERKLCNEIVGRYLCHKVELETTPLELRNISIALGLLIIVRGRSFSLKHCVYALTLAVPLIPHELSGILLSSSDRIIIGQLCGAEEAALYSLASTVGMIITVLSV